MPESPKAALVGNPKLGMRSYTHKLPDHTYIAPDPREMDNAGDAILRAGEVQRIADQVVSALARTERSGVKAIKNKK